MLILLALAALVVVLIYLSQQRRSDVFASRRERCRQARERGPRLEEPINPDFQFDLPPSDAEKDKETP